MVCYPIVFDLSDFYLSQDVMLLIDDIKVSQGLILFVYRTYITDSYSVFVVCRALHLGEIKRNQG